jgi:hypothetical protein
MWISLALLVLAAPPPPPTPAAISAPFGQIGAVVDDPPAGGMSPGDRSVTPTWEGCPAQGIYLVRMLAGTTRALEQLQQSLDAAPGAEKRLFARKGVLAEVMRTLTGAAFEPRQSCAALPVSAAGRLEVAAAPKRWCPAEATRQDGEFWFFTKGKPGALVHVARGGEASPCKPRLSVVLFDAKAAPRVRLDADWGGAMRATLVGDRCTELDYEFDAGRQEFTPAWKSCKR